MNDFTEQELRLIGNTMTQLTFKAGQSPQVLMVENIINKIKIKLPTEPEAKEEE